MAQMQPGYTHLPIADMPKEVVANPYSGMSLPYPQHSEMNLRMFPRKYFKFQRFLMIFPKIPEFSEGVFEGESGVEMYEMIGYRYFIE